MAWSRRWALMALKKRPAIRLAPDGWRGGRGSPRTLARLLGEVVVVRHAPADVGVEVPLHRALGELLLRLDDLLEQRVVGGLLRRDLVVDLELLLEDRVRGLVEPDLVLALELDVVLRVSIDRLPRHVR